MSTPIRIRIKERITVFKTKCRVDRVDRIDQINILRFSYRLFLCVVFRHSWTSWTYMGNYIQSFADLFRVGKSLEENLSWELISIYYKQWNKNPEPRLFFSLYTELSSRWDIVSLGNRGIRGSFKVRNKT